MRQARARAERSRNRAQDCAQQINHHFPVNLLLRSIHNIHALTIKQTKKTHPKTTQKLISKTKK